jgi:drug/metabolite transporter (DMT)-like permease
MTNLTAGIAGGLGTGLSWAAISILARSLSGRMGPAGINALRSTVGGGILLSVAVVTGHGGELVRMPLWVFLSLWVSVTLAMAVGDTLFFASMEYLGVTRALTLSLTNPLLTTVVGIGLLGEPVTLPMAIGILLVVGGLSLIVSGKGVKGAEVAGGTKRGLRLVFLAAGAWALAAVIMKPALQAVSAIVASAVRSPLAGLVLWLTPWTRGTGRALIRSTRRERVHVAAICVLSAAATLSFTVGIKFGGVAVGNALSNTSPLFALPFELLVLGERPSLRTTAGAAATVVGIGLMHF